MNESSTLYREVAADLRNRIISNQFKGERLDSERKLALEYKVNRITLRNALELLRQENLIYKKEKSGNYIKKSISPDQVLRDKTVAFVLVSRDRFDLYHANILMLLEGFARKYDLHVSFSSLSTHNDTKDFVRKMNRNGRADAIFLGGLITPGIAREFKKSKVPAILMGHLTYPDPVENEFDRVTVDNFEYSYLATDYLIRQGCRKLGLINRFSIQFALNNQYGFMKALDLAGIKFKEEMVIRSEGDQASETENKTVRLIKNQSPDALFVANERMLPEVFSAISKTDMKNIKVITIGGVHKEFSWNYNLLSINLEKIVKEVLKILVQRLRYPECDYIHYEYSDFKII